jgi:hypothetical protein
LAAPAPPLLRKAQEFPSPGPPPQPSPTRGGGSRLRRSFCSPPPRGEGAGVGAFGHGKISARFPGRVEGSCGRSGGLHFSKTFRRTGARTGVFFGPGPRSFHLLPRCCSLGLGAADSRHSSTRVSCSPWASRPSGPGSPNPLPEAIRHRCRETPILPTAAGGPGPPHPQERMGGGVPDYIPSVKRKVPIRRMTGYAGLTRLRDGA